MISPEASEGNPHRPERVSKSSNKERVFLEAFHRDEKSLGDDNRLQLGQAIYHWAILIRPKDYDENTERRSFDVTDAVRLDGLGNNLNPDFNWWFRDREPINPLKTTHFLGAVMIGKLPGNAGVEDVRNVLVRVPLPEKGQTPEQNCVTWSRQAILALQQTGYAESIDVDEIMNAAMTLARVTMKSGRPKNIKQLFGNATQRPA